MPEATRSVWMQSLIGAIALTGLGAALYFAPTGDKSPIGIEANASVPDRLTSFTFDQDVFGAPVALTKIDARVKRRETMSGLMDRMDVDRSQAGRALYSLTEPGLLNARKIRAGQAVTLYLDNGELTALSLQPEPGRSLLAKRDVSGNYNAFELAARVSAEPTVVKGTIETSLYNDARALGAGDQQVVDFAQAFAFDVDFQREIHPDDTFEIVFESMVDERGRVIERGNVIYAELNGRAIKKRYYQFTTPDEGITDYFDETGQSATRFLMKTPINGARLSSHFGKRRHPISGYTRLHKGTDFAAPTGTPVYAAGHGTVERASRYGGYGHYVRIRHANGYKTAYAHLSRYGRGVKSGRRVRQGDIIGYVGSTGASTGPHLHYEVHKNGKAVNAMRLKLPTGRKLENTPEVQAAFDQRRDEIDIIRGVMEPPAIQMAETSVPPTP